MQTLLNLLSSVALLVWGTHIVRTGILRVFGANLRHVLARSVKNRASALKMLVTRRIFSTLRRTSPRSVSFAPVMPVRDT